MRKRLSSVLLAGVTLLVPVAALAFNAQSGQNVNLAKGETKSGTYYVAGQVLTIDGDVDGDLVCAGSTVAVNGAVHGDVLCGGQSVTINGPVDGSVRVAGQSVNINGTVGRNVTVMGQTVTAAGGGHVSGDFGALGQVVSVNGPVDKDVYGAMDSLAIGGTVGAVNTQMNNLTLASGASVRGNLSYTSEQTFNVDRSKIGGEIQRHAPAQRPEQHETNSARAAVALRLYWILATLATGLVLVWLVPRLMRRVTGVMLERPGASIGWGLIVALLAPVLAVLLMVTVIGIPLGLLVLMLWGILLGLGGVIAGIGVGRWFLRRAEWQGDSLLWAAAFGIPLTVIIFSIPVLGGLLGLVAVWWAIGGVILSARELRG